MNQIKTAIVLLLCFIFLTGIIYPAIITGIAQLVFPWQANGSLLVQNGKMIGSVLIGQSFTAENYFWGRPSATKPFPYNAQNSSGSNFGPLNAAYFETVKTRIFQFGNQTPIPVDLVTASGSGLDPDISPQAAYFQIPRIAKARRMTEADVKGLIDTSIQPSILEILGEARVNVLLLNLALDQLSFRQGKQP